jgi:hypothetical protein
MGVAVGGVVGVAVGVLGRMGVMTFVAVGWMTAVGEAVGVGWMAAGIGVGGTAVIATVGSASATG